MTPKEIVQKQVEAYNSRDIDTFAACHHPEVELFIFPEVEPFAKGNATLKERYRGIFNESPNLNCQVNNRIVMGNTVIDHETVTGRKGVAVSEIIAIYEIKDGLIFKAHFIWKK